MEPDKKPGSLLNEQAADLAKTGAAAVPGLGAAVAGIETGRKIVAAATTEGGISDYLIAGGGGKTQSDGAISNAVLGALNRIAGFKSRM
jgi:hypothetical protein